jgi:hypothetical protein
MRTDNAAHRAVSIARPPRSVEGFECLDLLLVLLRLCPARHCFEFLHRQFAVFANRLVRHGIGPGQLPDPTTSLEASLRGLCALHIDASQPDGRSDDLPKCDQGGS